MRNKYMAVPVMVLILMLALFLPGCGEKDVQLELGKTVTVKDYIQFTPKNVLVRADEIYAPKGHEDGWVYEGDLEDQVYVVLTAKVKNVSSHTIKVVNLAHPSLKQGGKVYTSGECMLLTENETQLQRSEEIQAGEDAEIYILIDGEEKTRGEAEISITFTSSLYDGEETYHLKCNTSKSVSVSTSVEKGQTIQQEGYGTLTFGNAVICKRVDPPKANKEDEYAYYTPKNKGELLMDVRLTAENTQNTATSAESFTGVRASADGQIYDGFVVSETDNGKDLKEKDQIAAGKTKKLHALVNVPKEWKSKDVTVYIHFNGQEYAWLLKGNEK